MSNKVTLLNGDCLQKLKELKDNSVDSVVTDPPYEIGFMGKGWDDSGIANNPELWKEVLRVLKPGGHLLSFSHSRTYHRQAVAVEDAGFEIRDQIMWIYGSGFPKSHNIGKSVDKIQGNSPYEGWGTALKPAHEPIVMARKPFKGTVARNVLEHGTGGINIDGCRIGYSEDDHVMKYKGYSNGEYKSEYTEGTSYTHGNQVQINTQGRFPANIIFDEEAGNEEWKRYFYCPKASKKDRNEGITTNQHPTVKPTDLMAYLVRLVTPNGGTVLDPFMGSGSTGKASVREGMNFIGIEREDEYMEIAKSRIEHEQSKHKHREFFDAV